MDAVTFFDAINLHKGPSLDTNFTLTCPYIISVHYADMEEVAEWGVNKNLITISAGLDDKSCPRLCGRACVVAGSRN